MTTTPTSETIRLSVLPTLIAHGFRWINASGLPTGTVWINASGLPTGTVVISRTSILDPVAYVWSDGTISACLQMVNSYASPCDVIPAEKFADYLDAAGIATRNRRHLTATDRIALVRRTVV